ncbi:ABC-2 type transport system permease protein [Neobacillus bataviensis]|uniref:ABC-2 type transport system permease protein n=1 Tax=Neobacillus bataviensis TaxID=220685 RepID=A0A561D8X2_9BACI|nr:ABC transporter permease subunit [Neobacillus bataviensis]TWD99568.1 ABC-2 type transport system permease protein [Neobacillus bataviensis]
MNIFLKELKSHRKSLIFWSIGVFLMVLSGMNKYANLYSTEQSMNDVMKDMPKSLQVIMGVGSLDLSKASGYYGMLFVYLLLMATIHAAMLGAGIIAKEERDKTSEFLFVKPVSRAAVITAKLGAALFNIVVFNLVTLVSSLALVAKYSKGEDVNGDITILMAGMLILQILFMVMGSAISALKKKSKKATSLSAGVMLLTFILSVAIDLNEGIKNLKYLSPFKYFEAKNVMYGGGVEPVFVVLSFFLIVAFTSVTYIFYKKRDLNI